MYRVMVWCSSGGSGHWAVVAFATFHTGEIDTREEHDQVRGADLDARLVVLRRRKTEAACLESLVPNRVAILFPEQELDAIGRFVAKDEHVSRERIATQGVADDGGQAVERLPKIRRLGAQPDVHGRGQAQHGVPPSPRASSNRTRVARSKPGRTRRQRPLPRMTSMALPSPSAGLVSTSATTRTGRNCGRSRSRRWISRRHQ